MPPTLNLLNLPNELLFLIAEYLGAKDLSSLILTSHALYVLFTPLLYDLGAQESYSAHTALYWAAEHGQAALVEELLLRGATVAGNAVRDNSTALHWAAKSGDEATTKLLLRKDASYLNAPDSKGEGPIFWAAKAGHEEVVRLLVENGAQLENLRGQLLLHEAINAGYPAIARILLENGADINRCDQFGWLPLHCAARRGDGKTTRLLLNMGAKVDELHLGSGATALHWAAKGGSEEVIRLLLKADACVEARDCRYAATPLHWAVFCGKEAAVRYLLKNGADINARCLDGNTVLHLALHDNDADHDAVVKLLLGRPDGPSVNSRNEAGHTPLHWPVFSGHHSSVEVMLKGGADIFVLDNHGRSVLDCAEERLDFEMIKILTRYGTKGWRQTSSVNWKILCRVTPKLVGEAFEHRILERETGGPLRRLDDGKTGYPLNPPVLYIPCNDQKQKQKPEVRRKAGT